MFSKSKNLSFNVKIKNKLTELNSLGKRSGFKIQK